MYGGEQIDVHDFVSDSFTASKWFQVSQNNPLAVNKYFHTMVSTFIEVVLNGGLFGELSDYFGVIEYQGRGTPHIHGMVAFAKID